MDPLLLKFNVHSCHISQRREEVIHLPYTHRLNNNDTVLRFSWTDVPSNSVGPFIGTLSLACTCKSCQKEFMGIKKQAPWDYHQSFSRVVQSWRKHEHPPKITDSASESSKTMCSTAYSEDTQKTASPGRVRMMLICTL